MLPEDPGNAASRLRAAGVPVVQIPLSRLRARLDPAVQVRYLAALAPGIKRIVKILRAKQLDLVVIGGLANPQAAIAGRLAGLPVVWQILDTRTPPWLRRAMGPMVKALADVVMCTGNEVAARHPGIPGLGSRLVPFYPPVDIEEFRSDPIKRAQARRELGVPRGACVIGTVGNINPQKGLITFLRAARRLKQLNRNLFFVILGATYQDHSAYEKRLNVEAGRLGLRFGEDIVIRDPGSRVGELAVAFDVFWLTSEPKSEGIPTAVEEAMSLGIPVVATGVGSVREVVDDGITGYVVGAGDDRAIAERTCGILQDPKLQESMGREARARAVDRYAVDMCAKVHLTAFEMAMRRRQGRY